MDRESFERKKVSVYVSSNARKIEQSIFFSNEKVIKHCASRKLKYQYFYECQKIELHYKLNFGLNPETLLSQKNSKIMVQSIVAKKSFMTFHFYYRLGNRYLSLSRFQ